MSLTHPFPSCGSIHGPTFNIPLITFSPPNHRTQWFFSVVTMSNMNGVWSVRLARCHFGLIACVRNIGLDLQSWWKTHWRIIHGRYAIPDWTFEKISSAAWRIGWHECEEESSEAIVEAAGLEWCWSAYSLHRSGKGIFMRQPLLSIEIYWRWGTRERSYKR